MAVRTHLVQEDHLVGKDVGRVAVVVVEVAKLVVEKARWAGDGITQSAPTCAMYCLQRSIWRWRFWIPNASLARAGMS